MKMELKLISPNESILHSRLDNFDFSNPPINPHELVGHMVEFMLKNNGLGLSANQLGLPYRVFVMAGNPPMAFFNPRIIDETKEQTVLEEGCLSYPNMTLKIKRPKMIKLRYIDFDGNVHSEKFIGMSARIIQHELDHLNGIDYTRRANPIHLRRALNQRKIIDRAARRDK